MAQAEGVQESGDSSSIVTKEVHDGVWDIELFLSKDAALNYACFTCGHVPKKCMADEKYRPICEPCSAPLIENGEKIELSPFGSTRVAELKFKCQNKLSEPADPHRAQPAEEKKDEAAAAPADNECEWTGCVKDWQSHNEQECTYTIIQCAHCNSYKCSKSVMSKHDDICPEKSIPCELSCGEQVLRKNMQDHTANHCRKTVLKCSIAGCGQDVLRENKQRHETQECSKRIVSCPYRKYGCQQPDIKAEELEQHKQNNQILHLQFQVEYLQNTMEQREQVGVIKMFSGKVKDIGRGWRLCNGKQGTVDLSNAFLRSNDNDDEKEEEHFNLCYIVKVPEQSV